MRILKAKYKTSEEFLESFDEDGGIGLLFCPTTRKLEADEPVVVEVNFPELPNKMMLTGRVVWWRAALPRLRVRAGARIAVADEDHDKASFVLAVARGQKVEAVKRRHQRIPVALEVRWRHADSAELLPGRLQDISVGGALLVTSEKLEHDDELVLELPLPGSAHPQAIAARVSSDRPAGVGIRFIYREGGGTQRLREVVRRLLDA